MVTLLKIIAGLTTKLLRHKGIFDAVMRDADINKMAAANYSVRTRLKSDLSFLVASATETKIEEAFFANDAIVTASVKADKVRGKLGRDIDFLVSSTLTPEVEEAFFANDDVVTASAKAEKARGKLGRDVDFLISSTLAPEVQDAFFNEEELVRAALKHPTIKNTVGNDLSFLVSSTLSQEMKNTFFSNGDVVRAAANFSAVKDAVRSQPINETDAVKFLKSDWPMKQRQLAGFLHLSEIRNQIKAFYGDAPAAERLLNAAPPDTGIANDIDLANFIIDCLCENELFCLRDQRIEFVDRHALWTLINEIILDEEYFFESDNSTPFIIDAGANFGLSSIYFKQLYPEATVLSFEPVPYLHELIEKNIANNDIKDVTVVKKALSESAGECKLFVSEEYSMAASLTDRRRKFKDNLHEITVETAPLSAYIDREVDFLKLDIEGSEGAVLLELGDKLTQVKQMCVEWHITDADGAVRLDDVLALLSKHGFIYQIGKAGNFARKTRHRPMTHVHENGTLNFWATRP